MRKQTNKKITNASYEKASNKPSHLLQFYCLHVDDVFQQVIFIMLFKYHI